MLRPQWIAMTKPTYSSLPIPGRTGNWRDEVIILCSRRRPKGGIQVSSGTRKRHSVRVTFIFMFLLLHVHVERFDWLDSVKATSSGRFCYLSARRSRLASLLRNHSSKMVSILNYLSRLARRRCLLRHPLPDQRNLGLQRSAP